MRRNPVSKFCLYRGNKGLYLGIIGKPSLRRAEKLLTRDKEVIVIFLHDDRYAKQFAFANSLRTVSVCSSSRLLCWTTHLITTKSKLAKRAKKKGIKTFLVERGHGPNSLF